MRLNRFLAAGGMGSRRGCEELITTGQVTVNGNVCTNLATEVKESDVVKAGNRVVRVAAPMHILLHKPAGYLCTASDTHERRTIFDLLPPNFPRLFNVGRLDKESEGLLILTNDGDLSLRLTHPRYKIDKEYEVVLDQPYDTALTERLLSGMRLQDGWAKAEAVHKLASNKLKIVLRQGLKRQIRLMLYELGYEVQKLVRTRIGALRIEGLPTGHWRALTQKEVAALLKSGEKEAAPKEAPERGGASSEHRAGSAKPRFKHAGEKSSRKATQGPERTRFRSKQRREGESGEQATVSETRGGTRSAGRPKGGKFAATPKPKRSGERGFGSQDQGERGLAGKSGSFGRKPLGGSKFSGPKGKRTASSGRPFRARDHESEESDTKPRRVEWAEPPRRAPRPASARGPREFGESKFRRQRP